MTFGHHFVGNKFCDIQASQRHEKGLPTTSSGGAGKKIRTKAGTEGVSDLLEPKTPWFCHGNHWFPLIRPYLVGPYFLGGYTWPWGVGSPYSFFDLFKPVLKPLLIEWIDQ